LNKYAQSGKGGFPRPPHTNQRVGPCLPAGRRPGGLRRLPDPALAGAVNPDPPFFNRDQSLFSKPLVGHSGVEGNGPGKMSFRKLNRPIYGHVFLSGGKSFPISHLKVF